MRETVAVRTNEQVGVDIPAALAESQGQAYY